MQAMTRTRLFATLLPLAVIAFCLSSAAKTVKVHMKDANGKSFGTVTIKPAGTGVSLDLHLKHLTPGLHAIHFHQDAKCDPPDFKSAGPHFNPDNKKHGALAPDGPHAGDMENFKVTAKGDTPNTTIDDPYVNMSADSHSIFSNGGTALIIHAKADDKRTDPSGNSGDRIACGVVTSSGHWW